MRKKGLELPEPPKYQENPNLSSNITFGSDFNKQLLSGDFTGNLSWLSPTVNNNNSALALQSAQGLLQPQFRDTLQQITNSAAANGQLESSTFTDALARSQSDLNSQYQSIVSQQAINDSNQSNSNRLNLLGQGLGGLQGFTGLAQNQTNSENSFNLANYENLVAQAIQKNQNSNRANSWQQALGFASPLGNDYLKSQGITNVPGYGTSDIMKMASLAFPGMGSMGNGFGNTNASVFSNTGQSAPFAGAYAMNSSNPAVQNQLYRGF